jgi:hypothetical protein
MQSAVTAFNITKRSFIAQSTLEPKSFGLLS